MFRHFITTIDYAKLIKMQANQLSTKVSINESKKISSPQLKGGKQKTHNLNNSVIRHH